jgi:NADH-quinone oxidoreductase subunit L
MPKTTGKGLLTMTSYSGAVVFMDDARTPLMRTSSEPLRAPFARFPINGGIHSFRIHPGSGLDDYLVTHVAMGEGREIALTAFGPTVTFRHVRDQLLARDAKGQHVMRDALVAKRGWGRASVITLACVLLFIGAIGKSAQIPLFVWLPDAMAGPTPVSALIHAATMVTAGVYMVARLGFLFALSHAACTVVACTGALTAVVAATIGFYQHDLKKILAYSTVSQLGFMMIGVGVGGTVAGIFHLITHACFKACLFLAAGSVIHALHPLHDDEEAPQDIRNMGGLKGRMPRTARAYFLACLAITAAPIPGLAGFWSKDDILVAAFTTEGLLGVPGWVIGGAGLVATMCTSFYMWRSYFLVFEGDFHPTADTEKIHESPEAMTRVLLVLSWLSVAVGAVLGLSAKLLGASGESLLEEWLEPVTRGAALPAAKATLAITWGVIAAAYGVSLAGYAIAKKRYTGDRHAWDARERRAPGFALLSNGYFVDAIYEHTILRAVRVLRDAAASLDRWVIDGLVNGAALFTRALAWVTGRADDAIVDGAVSFVAESTMNAGDKLRSMQTGRIQSYVYAIVAGVLAVAILQYWLR